MTQRHARPKSEAPEAESALPRPYRRACRLAAEGRHDLARRMYLKLRSTAEDPRLRALIANDLATLAAAAGETEDACRGWQEALDLDAECLPARLNLALMQADLAGVGAVPAPVEIASPPPPPDPGPAGPIRVAILSFLFNWPSTGGGIVHTVELAAALARAGYEVRHFYARNLAWGVGRVEAPTPHPAEALEFDEASWNLPEIQGRFRRAVDAFGPDRVLITDSWNIKPLLAEAVRGHPYILRFQALECLCPLNNVRLLPEEGGGFRQCHFHQLASPDECARCLERRGHFSGALHRAERALCGVGTPEYHGRLLRALREAEAVLVVNPLMEAMISPYAGDVRVVTAGMDPARFPWPPPDEAREPAPGGMKTVLFAGLVEEPMKGFAVLHEACRRLRRRRADFALVATGDPPGPVDAFTRFAGWQSQEDLPRLLYDADLLVIPTIAQEALGRTAVEAMAAGRPVVASRLGGLPFTVADGATGLLCEPGDPDDLAAKIEILLDDPALRHRMGTAGRRRFEEHYAWDGIIERHYRPLLRRRGRASVARPYTPFIPDRVDQGKLVGDLARFLGLPRDRVEDAFRAYRPFHEAKGYARTLGELKTLCFEEAFVVCQLLSLLRPRTIVEVGTQHGKSTRRLLDMVGLLGLDCRVVCFDTADLVRHFAPGEAELVVGDVTGRFRDAVLRAHDPGLVFLDVHAHALLAEAIAATLADPGLRVLAIHDCGRGLCNPRMAIPKDDPAVTSLTGVWERHILAEAFGVDDPLSGRLDDAATATHRLRIFDTPHGLAVVVPAAMHAPGPPGTIIPNPAEGERP